MSKLSLTCKNFRPFQKNTLVGFAEIFIEGMHLTIKDIALHQKNASRWAALPSKPMLRDGAVLKDAEGNAQYVPILQFSSRDVSNAFSAAVVEAVLKHSPDAFGAPAAVDPAIPF
jgi:hypothetical protein